MVIFRQFLDAALLKVLGLVERPVLVVLGLLVLDNGVANLNAPHLLLLNLVVRE